jgi:hypothetical protein
MFGWQYNVGDPEPSKMDTFSESTKGDHEVKTLNHTKDIGTDEEKLREESDEALIPLISILKKCKRNKNRVKKGKGVTFSGIDALLGPDEDRAVCTADTSIPLCKNEDGDASSKCLIDLNEPLPEPIDLNTCSEDHIMKAFNSIGSPIPDVSHSLHGTPSLPLNSQQKMLQPTSEFTKSCQPLVNLNSDLSTISTNVNACTKQLQMVPRTVRLMGKDVIVIGTNLKSVSPFSKAQETASSSHASSSYYSDGATNKDSSNFDNKSCLEMNFGTGQLTPGNFLPANYITANPGPVISFPMVPGFNFYHHQFPVVSPPMISFPLGSSVFPQPYGLNFSGFRDENNYKDKSLRKMDYMK